MNQNVILLPTQELVAQFWKPEAQLLGPDALAVRDAVITSAQGVERVIGATSSQAAVLALGEIKTLLDSAEDTRKAAKDPFFKFGQKIDGTIKEFVAPLLAEQLRLKKACGVYQAEQDRIAREARQKQEAELARLQAERKAAEMAAQHAQTIEQQAKAQEAMLQADVKAAEIVTAVAPAPVTPVGAKIKRKLQIEVLNPAALYKVFPNCIELKPKLREINAVAASLALTLPEGEAPVMPGCKIEWVVDVDAK